MGYELLNARPSRRRITPRFLIVLASSIAFAFLLFHSLLSVAPCMTGSKNCYHGYGSLFSFDADDAHNARWMGGIPDQTPLTSLSIPGTHDTMTYNLTDNEQLQCQNWNLSTQLDAGVRYFDIRARLEDDTLRIYHADGFTGFDFTDVLLAMFQFLDDNPTETVIMRLKEEGRPIGDKNTITFEEAFNWYRSSSPLTASGSARHFALYNPSDKLPIPTLGALRGKIFLLQNFKPKDDPTPHYGLEWDGPQMALEDFWIIPDVYHLPDKWVAIRDALERAATAPLDDGLLYLAHVSASVGVLPIEAAAGPLNRTVSGMNDMTGQWVKDYEKVDGVTRTGVVIIDFPGKKLIEAILAWNHRLVL